MIGTFIGWKKKIQYLQAFSGNKIIVAGEKNLSAHIRFCVPAQFPIRDEILDAGNNILLIVGFSDKVVGAGLKSFDDVRRFWKRGNQDDRHVFQFLVRPDAFAEFIAVHLGHQYVGDDDIRNPSLQEMQGFLPVDGQRDPKVLFF